MLVDVLKKNIGVGKPIFSQEIISLYPNYSRAQVYRYIKEAIKGVKKNHWKWIVC